MRLVRFALCLSTISIVSGAVGLEACGDKFLRLAARLGPAYTAEHQASVLIYMPPGSTTRAVAGRLGLQPSLRRAGHRAYVVDRDTDLAAALSVRRYDVVIAEASASELVEPLLLGAEGRPTFLPVFVKESKREAEMAAAGYHCRILASQRAYHAVAEIDHVMSLRRSATDAS